jgi:hypothetical protein
MFLWIAEKLGQPKQLEKATMDYYWWAANKYDVPGADERGATRGLIFTTFDYMLNNVVNLVKCVVFILLVVVMFNQDEFWSLPVTMFWDNLK